MRRVLSRVLLSAKGTLHAKMGLIKDRNGMDVTEAKDIKKRWQEYTEELYKKDPRLSVPTTRDTEFEGHQVLGG